MNLADLQIPDDREALKAMVAAMALERASNQAEIDRLKTANATTDERIAWLTSILEMFQRAQHGRRSERLRVDVLNDEQHAFVFDEIEIGLGDIQAGLESPRCCIQHQAGLAAAQGL